MFLDPACFATEEGRDTWNRGSNSASTLEGLGEPLTQFHFRSSIRPVARKRPKRTVTRHTASRTNAQFWTPTGAVVRVPSLQLVLDAGLRPLHAARVPPLLLAVSWRGRRQPPAGGEEPSNQRPPAGEGCSQSKWGRRRERERERSEDAAALFNGDWLSSNGAAAWRAWAIWWHPSGQK